MADRIVACRIIHHHDIINTVLMSTAFRASRKQGDRKASGNFYISVFSFNCENDPMSKVTNKVQTIELLNLPYNSYKWKRGLCFIQIRLPVRAIHSIYEMMCVMFICCVKQNRIFRDPIDII
ncbi:hypothetical protein LOTGIDRAFT_167005 [Lottia gigantea]|uniref:Uncharacterized protein n=1 Tax=Lottia gigantea TaxID=225164 RepID=V4BDF1_LOTGI|nr:hypothetical protein LOTGIDRAFT_167005 [Lottia gigantea]ESO86489.1 hypothetical protein LOTGIDRAFT_167005 [Lottia gigantea]